MDMDGLPRVASTTRRRAVWEMVLIGGVERMTDWLMSGQEVPEADLADMRLLRMRLQAFDRALSARERAAGVVIESEGDI